MPYFHQSAEKASNSKDYERGSMEWRIVGIALAVFVLAVAIIGCALGIAVV